MHVAKLGTSAGKNPIIIIIIIKVSLFCSTCSSGVVAAKTDGQDVSLIIQLEREMIVVSDFTSSF